MRKVLLDPNVSGPRWTYFMFRGLPILSRGGIRCDLTIMLPNRLGREFNKTFGHIHQPKEPETYKVFFGEALFLLQKMEINEISKDRDTEGSTFSVPEGKAAADGQRGLNPPGAIREIKLVSASAGDKITIPGGWHHKTINIGKAPLLLINWIKEGTRNNYDLIEEKQGFGYYVVVGDNGKYELVENKNYGKMPKAKVENPAYD